MEQNRPSHWKTVQNQLGFSNERKRVQEHIEAVQEAFDFSDKERNVATVTQTAYYVRRPRLVDNTRPPLSSNLQVSNQPSQSQVIEEDGVRWGTTDEVNKLNGSVMQCLEVEGLKPDDYFKKDVKDFPSLTEFYIDLHKRLLPAEIDLFVSLWSRLTPAHPLVKSMKRILDSSEYEGPRYDLEVISEEEPVKITEGPRTLLTKEPTMVQREAEDLAAQTVVPGIHSFGEECRTYSWVVRINAPPNNQPTPSRPPPPQPVNQPPMYIPGLQAPFTPVIGGSAGQSTVTSVQSHGCPEVIPIVNTISSTAYAIRAPENVVRSQPHEPEPARCFPRLRKFFCFSS